MSSHLIGVFLNSTPPTSDYRAGDRLLPAVMFRLALPGETNAEQAADWTFRVLNTNPEDLSYTGWPAADTAFWLMSFYRLLRFRSLSAGDVVQVVTHGDARWLVCEPTGWTTVAQPPGRLGWLETRDRNHR